MNIRVKKHLDNFLSGLKEFENQEKNDSGLSLSEYIISHSKNIEYLLNNGVDIAKYNDGASIINIVKYLIKSLKIELKINKELDEIQKNDIENKISKLEELQKVFDKYLGKENEK